MAAPDPITRSIYRNPQIVKILDILLAVVSVGAIATLVMKYGGFGLESLPFSRMVLNATQKIIVGWFILDRIAHIFLARSRWAYVKSNWLDHIFILLFLVAIALTFHFNRRAAVSAGALYLIITQVYLLAALGLRAVSANLKLAGSGLPPSWMLIGTFAGLCVIGSGLLMLPAAIQPGGYENWSYGDALFTATSATCVTGLVVADTGTHFTTFGQAVILSLIQLGGLGIMIFGTVLAMMAGKRLSVRGSEAVGEMLGQDEIGGLGRAVRFVVWITFILEVIGAVTLYPMFRAVPDAMGNSMAPLQAAWHAAFHSISAFCNAGFALYGDNLSQGVAQGWAQPLRNHWQIMGVFAPLIILGGLGFMVLQDGIAGLRVLLSKVVRRWRKYPSDKPIPRIKLSLHSKIVLTTSVTLITLGAVVLGLLEIPSRHDGWREMSAFGKITNALFQSITARTAGFNTVDMDKLSDGAKVWMCGLMTIGGSPASTAGGVKTATVAILLLAMWSFLRRRAHVEAFGRSVPTILLQRAVTLIVLYMGLLIIVTLLLCVSMQGEKFIDLFFESCSACGTVGLSTGVTNRLGLFGKYVIIAGMFIGRLGPMTILLAMTARLKPVDYSYPDENIVIL
ncbi:MAG: hypothetical protein K8S55_11000 [Phycisphaerae bacterium]|nr:hypothetical protein [Phycisphaerae bacterium]